MIRPVVVTFAVTLIAACMGIGCGTSSQQKATTMEITSASVPPSGRVNMTYTFTLGISGGISPFTWIAAGSVPPGLTFDNTGKLSGTPTQSGSFTFFATVTDSSPSRQSQSITLSVTVADQILVAPATLSSTSPGVTYAATLSASGGAPPYTWSIVSGSLPPGLTLNATSGAITGVSSMAGSFTFAVGVADSVANPPPVTTNLSITVNPAPRRDALLYTKIFPYSNTLSMVDATRIAADGSLSSGGPAGFTPPDGNIVASPTLPLIFAVYKNQNGGIDVHSVLINPDYTTTLVATTNVMTTYSYLAGEVGVAVDPTGTNLYFTGNIIEDQSSPGKLIPGVSIYTANAYPQAVASLSLADHRVGMAGDPGIGNLVFTPDGTKAFAGICPYLPPPDGGSIQTILVFSRAPDGTLAPGPTLDKPRTSGFCEFAVSPDGKYLATGEVQVYQIESDGSLSPILPTPFIPTFGSPYLGQSICSSGITWDVTGSYVLVAADCGWAGGLAVMNFAGGGLTQTYFPSESFGFDIFPQPLRNFFYGAALTNSQLNGMAGYQLENGALLPIFAAPSGPPSVVLAAY